MCVGTQSPPGAQFIMKVKESKKINEKQIDSPNYTIFPAIKIPRTRSNSSEMRPVALKCSLYRLLHARIKEG